MKDDKYVGHGNDGHDKIENTNAAAGNGDAPRSPGRRRVLVGVAVAGAALAVGDRRVFAAGSVSAASPAAGHEIRIGFISPRSGKLGLFGHSDPYILKLARRALAQGITVNGETYAVKIIDRDSQSSPSRASDLAHELITKHQVHLILAASTPEVTNPVADACEAAGVPNLATLVPWEAFYFARGAKPGKPSPFKWSYVFSFGTNDAANAFLSVWGKLKTNKKVAALYPNDADGNAVRASLIPILEKNGYKVIDAGPYADGTSDFSAQIALFKRENCEIFNSFPIPSDFDRFWRQAAQQRYTDRVKVAQVAKTCQFPSQVIPLGPLGYGLTTATCWCPVFPYKSSLTGLSSQQLADSYEAGTGEQWTQNVGTSMSLLDAGLTAVRNALDPTSRVAIRDAIAKLRTETVVGMVDFTSGPYPNVSPTPEIGVQWVKAPAGSKYKVNLLTVENAADAKVPIQRQLVAYNA